MAEGPIRFGVFGNVEDTESFAAELRENGFSAVAPKNGDSVMIDLHGGRFGSPAASIEDLRDSPRSSDWASIPPRASVPIGTEPTSPIFPWANHMIGRA